MGWNGLNNSVVTAGANCINYESILLPVGGKAVTIQRTVGKQDYP